MPYVLDVVKGSICDEGGVNPGDELISINGEAISDIFDYRFQICNEELEICVLPMDGEEFVLEVEKDEDEDIGLVFENSLMDGIRSCNNSCVFCFIDQMPDGMRDSLYVKDDDLRMSFTNGNYVTLTNAGDDELQRIIRYRMSPINVSVHSTDDDLRSMMLRNGKASGIMESLRRLTENGIDVNCQIVLCKGINDQQKLEKTLDDLASLGERIRSISVVPAGLTAFREGLYCLEPYNGRDAKAVLDSLAGLQVKYLKQRGVRLVYPADEFFVLSGEKTPEYDYYDGFPQLENGVGMLALFRSEFKEAIRNKVKNAVAEQIVRRGGCHPPESDGSEHDTDGSVHDTDGSEHDISGSVHDTDGSEHDTDGSEHDTDGSEHESDGSGCKAGALPNKKIYIATGVAAAAFIGDCATELMSQFAKTCVASQIATNAAPHAATHTATNAAPHAATHTATNAAPHTAPHVTPHTAPIEVIPVKNSFFGGGVTVTGLLTGHDIISAFKGFEFAEGSAILISNSMLRHGTETLLDDICLDMLRKRLKVDIIVVENSGFDFVDKIWSVLEYGPGHG